MIRFVLRKMLHKKWLMAALLIGNILLIAIAAGSPMYTDAALQRMLTDTMTDYVVQNGRYPTTAYLLSTLNPNAKAGSAALNAFWEEDALAARLPKQLGLPSRWLVRNIFLTDATIRPEETRSNFRSKALRLGFLSGLEEHAQILSGRLYQEREDGVIEVLASQKALIGMNLMLGETYTVDKFTHPDGTPLRIQVVGIFDAADSGDHYWYKSPSAYGDQLLMSEQAFTALTGDLSGLPSKVMGLWFVIMDYEGISIDRAPELYEASQALRAQHKQVNGISYSDYFADILEAYMKSETKITVTLRILQVPIYALLVAFIFMVAGQILSMEQSEISVIKSRGAGKHQILSIYLLQSLLVAAASLIVGLPLAALICQVLGSANAFLEFVSRRALSVRYTGTVMLYALGAAVLSICAMVLPALRYAKLTIVAQKQKKRKSNAPWFQRFFVDILLLALSLYALYSFNAQKADLARRVLEGQGLDPLLFLASSLFIVSLGLLALRIVPAVSWVVYTIGKKHWSPALYSSFLWVLRTRSQQGYIVAFLVITLAIGIFNAQTARTVNTAEEERLAYMAGADIVLQEAWTDNREESVGLNPSLTFKLHYFEPDFGKYLALDGAEMVTKVINDREASCNIKQNTTSFVDCQLMGINTKEFGQCVDFKTELLPVHWYEYLNAMAPDPTAVLASVNMHTQLGYELGDTITYRSRDGFTAQGVICGFVDYWPSYNPKTTILNEDGTTTEMSNYLIVGHFGYMMSVWDAVPYQVWMKSRDTTDFIYDFAAASGTRFTYFTDVSAQMVALKNDPIFQGTNGILTLCFVVALTLCAVGFLIYWILSIRSRTLLLGIFRAMGMTMREIISMLINEQVFISLTSIALGVGAGILTSRLYIPLVQIAYASADTVIPLEIVAEGSDMARLLIVVAVMVALCMAVLGVLISRIRISQALKLGED